MKSRTNRVLSMILALVMVFSLVPASAFADSNIGGTSEPGGLGLAPGGSGGNGGATTLTWGPEDGTGTVITLSLSSGSEFPEGACIEAFRVASHPIYSESGFAEDMMAEAGLSDLECHDMYVIMVAVPAENPTEEAPYDYYDIPDGSRLTVRNSAANSVEGLEYYSWNDDEFIPAKGTASADETGLVTASFDNVGGSSSLVYAIVEQPDTEYTQTEAILAACEKWFGEGGNWEHVGSITVYGPELAEDEEDYYAGGFLNYSIACDFKAAPTWSTGYPDGAQTVTDIYNATVSFTLPLGLKLVEVSGLDVTEQLNPDGTYTYVGTVTEAAASSTGFEAGLSVYITGNGTDKAIADYGPIEASLETSFNIVNKEKGEGEYKVIGSRTQTESDRSEEFETTTNDVWGVEKRAPYDVEIVANGDGTVEAKVRYLVSVGMKTEDGQQKEIGQFRGTGRVAIESMDLKDVLLGDNTYFKNNATQEVIKLTAEDHLKSATISKKISDSELGESVSFANGEDIVIVGEGARTELSLNTVAVNSDHNYADGKNNYIPAEAPSYTEYVVEAVYELPEGAIATFDKPNNEVLLHNDVRIESVLYNKGGTDEDEASAEKGKELPKTGKASFRIEKDLTEYKGTPTNAYDDRYGTITYELADITGETEAAAVVYEKVGDEYIAVSEPLVEGKTYYVNTIPGAEYAADEKLTGEQSASMEHISVTYKNGDTEETGFTPEDGEKWKIRFVNREKAADVVVSKVDDNGVALEGATFTLTGPGISGSLTCMTGTDGKAKFEKLPYGEGYRIKETGVPSGYTGSFAETFDITGNADVEFTATNVKRFATVQLTKYVGIAEDETLMNPASEGFGTFELQRRPVGASDDEWEKVSKDVYDADIVSTVNSEGKIIAVVPAYTADGTVYEYRFVEVIPEGYYDPYGDGISDPVDLVDTDGKAERETVNVNMYNRQKVTINIAKKFYETNRAKLVEKNDKTANVTLYRYDGAAMTAVEGGAKPAGTAADGTPVVAEWSGLPLYDGSTKLSYYVAEEDVDGYKLDVKKSGGTPITIGEKTYLPVDVTGAEAEKTLYNIEQVIPVIIYKKNYYTKAFVSGAGVTVYEENGTTTATDAKNSSSLGDKAIKSSSGLTVYLTPGQKYNLVETQNETGLIQVNATAAKPIVIDLSKVTAQTYGSGTPQYKTYTVYNKPEPLVAIKKVSSTDTKTDKTVLTGAEFTLYKKDGNIYKAVTDASGSPIVIPGTGVYSNLRLPVGEYYVAETAVPTGCIDPNVMPQLYSAGTVGTTDTGATYTFFELNVADATWSSSSKEDNKFSVEIANIPNEGQLIVYKHVDGEETAVSGFKITATGSNGTEENPNRTTLETDGSSYVTFTLPVYDASGNRITYTVTEDIENMPAGYCAKNTDYSQTAELSLGQSVSTDKNGEALIVDNETLVKISAGKLRINTWEHDFTGIAYLMPDVTVGLYRQNADGNWELLETKNTDGMGQANFEEMVRRDGRYAVVEIAVPGWSRMFPTDGKIFAADENGNALTEISEEDLERYNVCAIPTADADYIGLDKANSVNNYTAFAGNLINKNHWLQFDITKWMDDNKNGQIDKEGDGADTHWDNAVFELYRYRMEPDQLTVEFPDERDTDKGYAVDGWELAGTYTSGTEYKPVEEEENRMTGQFRTDIEQGVDESYIYVLVETKPGPGAEIIPAYEKTAYVADGSEYNVTGVSRHQTYLLDHVNEDDILNTAKDGPGDGTMLASIRLAKWADSFDALGQAKQQYIPLPNAKFEVRLPNGTVIAELTSGLDAKPIRNPYYNSEKPADENNPEFIADKAWAQSGIFWLKDMAEGEDGAMTANLVDYERDNTYPVGVTVLNSDTAAEDGYTVYGVETKLFEVSAPEDYGYSIAGSSMYLCFVTRNDGQNSWYFNDAYFVTNGGRSTDEYDNTKDENGKKIVLAENQNGKVWYLTDAIDKETHLGTDRVRIVDYPTHNTIVELHKYGYRPNESTVKMTSAELDKLSDSAIDRRGLRGVTMAIEYSSDNGNTWHPYNYAESSGNTFTTGDNGTFLFPDGLPMGRYRVYETSLGSNTGYEMAYKSNAYAREFVVGGEPVTVTMYNPVKAALTVKKIGADTQLPVAEIKFTLTPKGGTGIDGMTDENGIAHFSNLSSGNYTLAEDSNSSSSKNTLNKAGYSYSYFKSYMTSLGSPWKELANSSTLIGYTYGTPDIKVKVDGVDTSVGKDVVISKIGLTDADISVDVLDPHLVGFSIKKQDEQGNPLAGAEFTVQRKKFSSWSGETDFEKVSWMTGSGWPKTLTTNASGTAGLTGTMPGIYEIKETKAPAGHDIIKDIYGNDIIYYVVLKGGMNVTVKNVPATAQYYDVNGEVQTVKTLYEGVNAITEENIEVPVAVRNRAMTTAQIAKAVTYGERVTSDAVRGLKWEVDFELQNAAGDIVGVASISSDNAQFASGKSATEYVVFTKPGSTEAARFSFGNPKKDVEGEPVTAYTTYYLKEVCPEDYEIVSVVKDASGNSIEPAADGRYPISVESLKEITIDATNCYMRGEVIFSKRDREDTSLLLPGAKFKVCVKSGEDWIDLDTDKYTITEIEGADGNLTGKYKADIRLVSAEERTYGIFETAAPDDYILEDGAHLDVVLSAANNMEDLSSEETLVNTLGTRITLTKYDNIRDAKADPPEPAGKGDAAFMLVKWNGTAWVKETAEQEKGTDENGKAVYLVRPGTRYGFIEYSFNSTKFTGLDSVYIVNKDGTETQKTPGKGDTVTINGRTYDVYDLGTISYGDEEILIKVYNEPKYTARIVKEDIGNYPEDVIPSASFSIYEVSKDFVPDEDNVLTLTDPVKTEATATAKGQTTYYDWLDRDPSKHYVVVEKGVSSYENSGDYNTFNKDYKDVVWFIDIPVMSDPQPGQVDEFVLENVYSEATVSLDKSIIEDGKKVQSNTVGSLLDEGCSITYSLNPAVESHNQALNSFVLKDSGLTFVQPGTEAEDYAGDVASYTINSIHIGQPSQNLSHFKAKIENAGITAKYSFFDAAGSMIGDAAEVEDVPEEGITVTAPTGTQSFAIEYYSPEVRAATGYVPPVLTQSGSTKSVTEGTGKGYSLGYAFNPGEVTVDVTVNKLNARDEVTAEVSSFVNSADVELTYPKWRSDGSGTEGCYSASADTAVTTVEPVRLPRISVEKDGAYTDPNDSNCKEVEYTITVNNLSDTAEFRNPVLLDMLPTGVAFKEVTESPEGCSVSVEKYTGNPTLKADETVIGDAETAVVFKLNGYTLEAEESVSISFTATVSDSAVIYGNTIENDVFASTTEHGHKTPINPNGYAFKIAGEDSAPDFAESLQKTAADLTDHVKPGSPAKERERALSKVLSEYEGNDFVWVKDQAELASTNSKSLTLKKAVQGDRDIGFHDEDNFLGHATRTNSSLSVQQRGHVDYRLTVYNGGETARRYLAIGDELPRYWKGVNGPDADKGHGSNWNAEMNAITSVTLNGEAAEYTLYYFEGDGAKAAVKNAMDATAEYAASWSGLPAKLEELGWKEAGEASKNVTAFLIVFEANEQLNSKDYIVVTYNTDTEDIQSDDEFNTRAAFENANNSFEFSYVDKGKTAGSKVAKIMDSNTVKVTLMDRLVSVEGDVWIDEDWDSTQKEKTADWKEGQTARRDYSEYTIIQQLTAALGFKLKDERQAPESAYAGKTVERIWDGIGESIKHFAFDELGAARLREGKTEEQSYRNETLDIAALKTSDPYNYSVVATISGDNAEKLKEIFTLTDLGEGNYMSDDPDAVTPENAAVWANAHDSNFSEAEGTYTTKPFYLRYSKEIDNSKDIGFRMYRDLEIEKIDSAKKTSIEGVKFSIYGPFDEGTATAEGCVEGKVLKFTEVKAEDGRVISYSLDPNGEVTELVTGEDGRILVTGLNWWKEYVIEETEAAKGYTISSAKASSAEEGTIVTALDKSGYWVLNLPDKAKVTGTEKVKITNAPLGEIRIVKNLSSRRMLDDEPGNTVEVNTLFIFDVKAVFEGKTVYSDVLSLNFTGPGTNELTVKNLPVGAEVTVTEIYAGNEYSCSGGDTQKLTVPDPDDPEQAEAVFDFTNSFNHRLTVSGGVVNHYAKNENGGWTWDPNRRDGNNDMVIEAMPVEEEENVPDEEPVIPA